MFVGDSRRHGGPGIIPLQDHGFRISQQNLSDRGSLLAMRVKRRNPLYGSWEHQDKTIGDVHTATLWPAAEKDSFESVDGDDGGLVGSNPGDDGTGPPSDFDIGVDPGANQGPANPELTGNGGGQLSGDSGGGATPEPREIPGWSWAWGTIVRLRDEPKKKPPPTGDNGERPEGEVPPRTRGPITPSSRGAAYDQYAGSVGGSPNQTEQANAGTDKFSGGRTRDGTTREAPSPGEGGDTGASQDCGQKLPIPTTGATAAQQDPDVLPVIGETWNEDRRFKPQRLPTPRQRNRRVFPTFPGGTYGITVGATDEEQQVQLFMPTDPRLIAPSRGNPNAATRICDVTPGGNIATKDWAPLHSLVRVLISPTGELSLKRSSGNALGLNLGVSATEERMGGYWVDGFDESSSGKKTPLVGRPSVRDGGHVDVGSGKDKHRIGSTGDGSPICPTHLSTSALFHDGCSLDGDKPKDGPINFETPNPKPFRMPLTTRVHMMWDDGAEYRWPRDDQSRSEKGKWKWWGQSATGGTGDDEDNGGPTTPGGEPTNGPSTGGPPKPGGPETGPRGPRPGGSGSGSGGGGGSHVGENGGGGGGGQGGGGQGGGGGGQDGGVTGPNPGGGGLLPGDDRVLASHGRVQTPVAYGRRGDPSGGGPGSVARSRTVDPDGGFRWNGRPSYGEDTTRLRSGQGSIRIPRSVGQTPLEMAGPAMVARPQRATTEEPDLQSLDFPHNPARNTAQNYQKTHPETARLAAFGAQGGVIGGPYHSPRTAGVDVLGTDGGGDLVGWRYTQRPSESRAYGGTANGGYVLLPPEVDLMDADRGYTPVDGSPVSDTYFIAGPGTRFGAGTPELADGRVMNGTVFGHEEVAGVDVLRFTTVDAASGEADFVDLRGDFLVHIRNVAAPPPDNPTNGGYLYVQGGALNYRGSSGTDTVVAPA